MYGGPGGTRSPGVTGANYLCTGVLVGLGANYLCTGVLVGFTEEVVLEQSHLLTDDTSE